MTYVTKKCPYCGYTYQFMKTGEQRQYGCPYQTCLKCHQHYFDTDIVEPALHGYTNAYETTQRFKLAIALIIYGFLGVLLLSGGTELLLQGKPIGIVCLFFGGFIAYLILSLLKQKIDDAKNYDNILQSRQTAYDESIERLKNIYYLSALAKHDKLAKKLLEERLAGEPEHYADRPQ